MVNINRIRISGFRNIENVDVSMNDITSMLSVNSYGKSNFLNSIVFGIDFILAQKDTKELMMDYSPYKPYNKKIFMKDFCFEIELIYAGEDGNIPVIYGYSFKWNRDNTKGKITDEYLKIKETNSQKFTSYIIRNNSRIVYKSSLTGSCDKKISIEDNDLIINKIMAFDNLFYLDIVKSINEMRVYVDRHFNTNSAYGVRRKLKKSYSVYDLNSDTNVPLILKQIKDDYPDKFKIIVNTLKDIFPFIEDINIFEYKRSNVLTGKVEYDNYIESDSLYFLTSYDKNIKVPIHFSDMSDGVRRVLLIFTTLTLTNIRGYCMIGIEEPENSLNPRILQRYLIALRGFMSNSKIIITSHSPYLINYMDPSNIYLGIPNNDGIADFSKISDKSVKKLYNDAESMDMLVGDYLFDLMSGSIDDLNKIREYTE